MLFHVPDVSDVDAMQLLPLVVIAVHPVQRELLPIAEVFDVNALMLIFVAIISSNVCSNSLPYSLLIFVAHNYSRYRRRRLRCAAASAHGRLFSATRADF